MGPDIGCSGVLCYRYMAHTQRAREYPNMNCWTARRTKLSDVRVGDARSRVLQKRRASQCRQHETAGAQHELETALADSFNGTTSAKPKLAALSELLTALAVPIEQLRRVR